MKNRELTINIEGNAASGKFTLIYLIKEMLKSKGLNVSFNGEPDYSSEFVFDEKISKNINERINGIKERTNISIKETQSYKRFKQN